MNHPYKNYLESSNNITLQAKSKEKSVVVLKEPAMYSEQIVIDRCILGDNSFQEILYNKYSKNVYGLCLRYVKNPDEAFDLTHDCFIKVFLNLKNFRNESPLKSWILKIAANEALQYLKKDLAKYFGSDVYEMDIIDDFIEDEILDKNSFSINEILEAINQLPIGYRTVLNLFAIENYSHGEISQKLGISINTSKTQLFKARKLLNEILKKNGKRK